MNSLRLNTKLISNLSNVLFMSAADMMAAANIATTTWYHIMQVPEAITIQQLLAIANGLHIPVRRFFSCDKTDIIGKREEYIAESYQACFYDAHALQEIVNRRADATWQKAADAVGMSRDNLRKSLLAVRRTPVTRFLAVCQAFNIDPFTVLVDPNPAKARKRSMRHDDIAGDIAALHRKIADLSTVVDDLTKKYSALLERHNRLERSVFVNIHDVSNSNIGIAAEPDPAKD